MSKRKPKFSVYLLPVGTNKDIYVPHGKKTVLGRGPFLGIQDPTVSRYQGELDWSPDGENLFYTPRGQRPSYLKEAGQSAFFKMNPNEAYPLYNLDEIAVCQGYEYIVWCKVGDPGPKGGGGGGKSKGRSKGRR